MSDLDWENCDAGTREPLRVLVTGSRDFTDWDVIRAALNEHAPRGPVVLIHGAARGADTIAATIAKASPRATVVAEPADWDGLGKAAGAIRNRRMLDYYKPNLVLAFFKIGAENRGTTGCVAEARQRGVPVHEYRA